MNSASLSDYGSVAAAVVASLAFLFGVFQFWKTQTLARHNLELQRELLNHEREAKAVDLFVRFSELKHSTETVTFDPNDRSQFWQHNAALAVIESVYKLTRGNREWSETVRWMLECHREFLCSNRVDGSTFTPAFVELMKQTVPEIRFNSAA